MIFFYSFILTLYSLTLPFMVLFSYLTIYASQLPIVSTFLQDMGIAVFSQDSFLGFSGIILSLRDIADIWTTHVFEFIKWLFQANPLQMEIKPYYEVIKSIINGNWNILNLVGSIVQIIIWPFSMIYYLLRAVLELVALVQNIFNWFASVWGGAYNTPLSSQTYPCTDCIPTIIQTIRSYVS